MQKVIGVVIGRFQLPNLHDGHKALINHVLAQSDKVCILVGVAAKTTLKDLLPYPVVEQMIRKEFHPVYAAGNLHIHPLLDIDGNDLQWSLYIDKFLGALYPHDTVQLWAGRDSYKPHYHGKFRPVKDWYGYNGEVNGTVVRGRIIEGNPIDCWQFRAGIIYGLGNYLRSKDPAENEEINVQT